MLLLLPTLTCADAGPDHCTLHPDLWRARARTHTHTHTALVLVVVSHTETWVGVAFSCIHWHNTLLDRPLQLALVVFSVQALPQTLYMYTSNFFTLWYIYSVSLKYNQIVQRLCKYRNLTH